jgi:hypothetical protein
MAARRRKRPGQEQESQPTEQEKEVEPPQQAEKKQKIEKSGPKNLKHATQTSALRFQEQKYILIGPPSYHVFKHMSHMYVDLRKLVEDMLQCEQQLPEWALSRLVQITNDLADVCGHAGPWLDRGLASLLKKIKKNAKGHDPGLFMSPEELRVATSWLEKNEGQEPPARNYLSGDNDRRSSLNKQSSSIVY